MGISISTIETGLSIAKPIVEELSAKLQPEMKAFAERLFVLTEKYPSIEKIAEVIDKAADILGDVLYVLGISSDPANVIGAKASQADLTVSDFNSAEDYIQYLKECVKLDKEKFESLSEEEKIAYTITGITVEAGAIGEKIGIEIPADIIMLISKIADCGKVVMEAKNIVNVLERLKDNGITNLMDVCEYFSGEGNSDRIKVGKILKNSIDEVKPGDADQILDEIKMVVRD